MKPTAISHRLQTLPEPKSHLKIPKICIFRKIQKSENPGIRRGRRQWAEPLKLRTCARSLARFCSVWWSKSGVVKKRPENSAMPHPTCAYRHKKTKRVNTRVTNYLLGSLRTNQNAKMPTWKGPKMSKNMRNMSHEPQTCRL